MARVVPLNNLEGCTKIMEEVTAEMEGTIRYKGRQMGAAEKAHYSAEAALWSPESQHENVFVPKSRCRGK